MDVFYYTIYYITLLFIPFVTYLLVFRKNRVSIYSGRDWLYIPKFYFAKKKVKSYQAAYKNKITKLGDKLESEINISSLECTDSQHFYGIDEFGNSLNFKLEIGIDHIAEASIHLRLNDGNIYVFPGGKGINQTNLPKNAWKIAGFNLEILEPFRKIRITFNGLLKNISCVDYDKIEHVKFNFIFTSFGSPFYIPQDIDSSLYASALAKEHWRDGSWKDDMIDQMGFEYFGVMKGFVKGDSYQEALILNLPTSRSRYKGIADRVLVKRMIRILISDEYGNMFIITKKSFQNGCSEFNYGFAYLSNERRYPIKAIDLKLHHIAENKVFPDCIKTNIIVNNKTYKLIIYLHKNKIIKSVNDDKYGYEYYTIPAECLVNSFNGAALIEFYYEKQGKAMYIPTKKLVEKVVKKLPTKYVIDIQDEESHILDLTGGKGNSLGLMSSLNSDSFIIPDGFIITVQAYRHQLSNNENLSNSISRLNDICCGKIEGNLEESCKEVAMNFKNNQIDPKIQENVINQLKKYPEGDEFLGWAVRSSAIGEDSDELSAAGQNDTFLGCQTEKEILDGVSACWASLYTYQSAQYRWQHGLPVVTDMAVVVQKMVKSDSAGVLFTNHPSTLNPSQMVINSNFGLGETVVSGDSDPDTFILNRTWDGKICLIDKTMGSKNKILKVTSNGLVETIIKEKSDQENWSISEKQTVQIGKVGLFLEQTFGNPRDIEWAFYKEKLYLLQSRPITTLNVWTDFELNHEMDTPLRTKNGIYTTANVKEVIPKGVTVLSQTSTLRCLDWALQKFVQQNFDPLSLKGMVTHQHNILLDVIMSLYKTVHPEIQISSLIVDLAVFGHPVLNENIHEITINRMGLSPSFTNGKELIRVMKNAWKNIAGESKKIVDSLNFDLSENDTVYVNYKKIDGNFEGIVDVAHCHSKTSAISVFYQVIAMNVLLEGKKELTTEHLSDFASMLSSCEDVISAEVPKYFEGIAKIIKEAKFTEIFSQMKTSEGKNWLKNNCHKAYELLIEFLNKHGHRNLEEMEVMEESWRENPSTIITMIQANLKSERKKKDTLTVDEIIKNLKSPKKDLTRNIIKFVVKKIGAAVGARELTKSEMIRAFDKLRQAYRFLGKQMVLNGYLPYKDLIYHLTHSEIGYLLEKRNPVLIAKAIRRQKLYPVWQKLQFPEIMKGVPRPEEDSSTTITSLNGVCKGSPVCSGIVTARACVIKSLDEIHQLQTGDILLTYSTDIGWSPYFPMLSGIATELGGLISHGAVVAREYGLPCVVGVRNITKYFKTGDFIQLNGNTGEIGKI